MLKLINQPGVEVPVKHSTFPAGEVYVKILEPELVTQNMTVMLLSADSEQIMRAIMLADALTILGAINITLDAPYLPYSRQDRACSTGESHSLNVFKDLLETRFDSITTMDIHNYPQSIGTIITSTMPDYEELLSTYPDDTLIVSPDKGAEGRCDFAATSTDLSVAYLVKERIAGEVKQTTKSIVDILCIRSAENILIIDDICDGGATFLSAAKVLRELNPTAGLHLFVTHGIFSQGMEKLEEVFDTVRCANRYSR